MTTTEISGVYDEYFALLDSYFGGISHHLGIDEDSHFEFGRAIANYPLISDLIIDASEDLFESIHYFWQSNNETVVEHIRNQNSLKCLYSGDITPPILGDFVKRSALYIDTAIIPDPVLNLTLIQRMVNFDKRIHLQRLIRHVFNVWRLRDLILSKGKYEPLILLPVNINYLDDGLQSQQRQNAEKLSSSYIGKLMDREFNDVSGLQDIFGQINETAVLYSLIKHEKLLPSRIRSIESFAEFFEDFSQIAGQSGLGKQSVGDAFVMYILSQFLRVQEHNHYCQYFQAEPIYDNDLAWFFYSYQYGGPNLDTAIANVLQTEEFEWVGNVPISALSVLREEEDLESMRGVLRRGITDLKAKNDRELLQVGIQVEENLKVELIRQHEEIDALEKKVTRITKRNIPITTGGFLAGFIPYLGNAVSLFFAGRDIAKLLEERDKAQASVSELKTNLISLLIKAQNDG